MSQEIRYAGFWIRAVADIIDCIFVNLVIYMLLGSIYFIYRSIQFVFSSKFASISFFRFFDIFHLQIILLTLWIGISFLYFSWATYRYGTTLGKRILRISVVSAIDYSPVNLKQSIARCLGYAVSYSPLGAGFFLVAVHPKKQALHDLLAGTVCIRKELNQGLCRSGESKVWESTHAIKGILKDFVN